MALAIAIGLFAVYFGNVVLGAFGGNAVLGDVGEMLTLFAASIAFVVAILGREDAARRNDGDQ